MTNDTGNVYQLSHYKVLDYIMTHVQLEIDLTKKPAHTKVCLTIKPNPNVTDRSKDLVLDGEHLMLTHVALNNRTLDDEEFVLSLNSLIIKNVPQEEEFQIETHSILTECTDLFGLYETDGIYLVKAETEGLRRIFYCIDRPDNLATYTTTIYANCRTHPVLLCNGRLITKQAVDDAIHSVTWSDTTPKPTYLFALVAGNLNYSSTIFKTQSGCKIPIEFYVSSQDTFKCEFAKEVLKKAMSWDETVCQLECELAQHIVAGVDKYASGASEPTGLNLFNTENLFATPSIKTDLGMIRVLEVVAHEFFHYWTGNRVTIRDWFNLTFKEGLTTFRAALFCEDLFGSCVTRLINGKNLDPQAPRQSSYTAVRSLYTIAAYEKGADIFRMMMLVIGKESFLKHLSHFLKKNDGGAVTIENLLFALTHETGVDILSFLPWFTEPGIPKVQVTDEYDAKQQQYKLYVKTSNDSGKPIPMVTGLLDRSGNELLADTLLLINKSEMEFSFDHITERPIPSLLRDFSAPVHLEYKASNEDLLLLMQYDSNLYNRCEAARTLIIKLVTEYCSAQQVNYPSNFFDTYRLLVRNQDIEPWILSELLMINSEEDLISAFDMPTFELITIARHLLQKNIAEQLKEDWHYLAHRIEHYRPVTEPQFSLFDITDAGMRRLKSVYYSYLRHLEPEMIRDRLIQQFNDQLNTNMTDTIGALSLLGEMGYEIEMDKALDQFYQQWHEDTHAINYWFRVQASLHSNQVVNRVNRLLDHSAFDILNPNKIYSLLGTFIGNPYGFHNATGDGYRLITKMVLVLDKLNPPLAANLAQKFMSWKQYDEPRKKLMLENLIIISKEAISVDVKNRIHI